LLWIDPWAANGYKKQDTVDAKCKKYTKTEYAGKHH
jgi:hypothetical protein